jgi:hypothetical protein
MSAQGIDAGLPDPAERTDSVADRVGEPDGRSGRRDSYRARNTTFEGGFGTAYQASPGIAVAVFYQIRAYCPVRAHSTATSSASGKGTDFLPTYVVVHARRRASAIPVGRAQGSGQYRATGGRSIDGGAAREHGKDCSGATDGRLKRIGSFR